MFVKILYVKLCSQQKSDYLCFILEFIAIKWVSFHSSFISSHQCDQVYEKFFFKSCKKSFFIFICSHFPLALVISAIFFFLLFWLYGCANLEKFFDFLSLNWFYSFEIEAMILLSFLWENKHEFPLLIASVY